MREKQLSRNRTKLGIFPQRYVTQTKKLRETLPNVFVKAVERNSSPLTRSSRNSNRDDSIEYQSDISEDEGYICKKCRNEKENDTKYEDVTLNNVSAAVFAIAHQLRKSKERRKCLLQQEKINEIKIRVSDALEHAGMDHSNDDDENGSMEPLFLDQEKEKRDERKLVTEKFTVREKLSKTQNNLLLDIDSWLYYLQEDMERLCEVKDDKTGELNDDEFHKMNEALKKSNIILLKISKAFRKHLSKSNKLTVNKEVNRPASSRSKKAISARDLTSQESSDNNEERLNIPNKIHTENDLTNPKSLKQALKTISSILDDGAKHSSSNQARKNYKLGSKQFKAITTMVERKVEYITEIEQHNKQLADEVTNKKYLEQQKIVDSAEIKRLKDENNSLNEQIKELQCNIDELSKRPSIMRQSTRHSERRVSIQLPFEHEASTEAFINNSEIEENNTLNPMKRENNSSRRTMVSRTYLQTNKSNIKTTVARHSNTKIMQENSPSVSINNNTNQIAHQQSIYSTQSIIEPQPLSSIHSNTHSITSHTTQNNEGINYEEQNGETKEVVDKLIPQTANTSTREKIQHFSPALSADMPEGERLKAQLSYFRGMLRNTEQTIADQQKEIERLSYAKTERKPSSLSSPAASDISNVKSSKSISKGLHKKMELLEHQLKKTKQEQENATHDLKIEKRNNDYLRLEVQKLLIEKEKLERKLYKESTTKLETTGLTRDQLLKKFRNESDKEVQRLRAYIINEQNRHEANLRRLHADHRNTVSNLKSDNVQMIRALNRFKQVVLQMLNETDIKELQTIDEVTQEEKLNLYEQGKDSTTLQETAIEILLLLEKSLQKLVLEKRLMIKQAQSSQQNTEQELEKFKIRLENTTTACVEQDHLIRRANQRNEILTKQYNELVVTNNDLQKEIGPCKALLDKYNNMQREIERLTLEEKATAKEAQQTIKEFENDRNRLKKELNRLNLTQICQLNAHQSVIMHGKNLHEKIHVLDKAYETSRINIDEHERATEIVEFKHEITNMQFARFVQRYVHYKKIQTLKEFLVSLCETYKDEKRFQKYYDLLKKREKEATEKWEVKKNEYRTEREKALTLLMKVFDKNQETDEDTPLVTLPLFRRSDNTKMAYRRKMMTKRKSIPKFPSTVSDIVGVQLQSSKTNGSYWQMPPKVPAHLVQINTPRILEMDVVQCRRPVAMMNRHQLRPAVASFFDADGR